MPSGPSSACSATRGPRAAGFGSRQASPMRSTVPNSSRRAYRSGSISAQRPCRGGCGGAGRHGHRFVHLRAPPERHATRFGAPGRYWSGTRSTRLPAPSRRGRGWAGHRPRGGRTSVGGVHVRRHEAGVVRKEIDAFIGDRLQEALCARRCGSCTTASPPSRRSTTSSATRSACAGRRWASFRCTGWPEARPACVTHGAVRAVPSVALDEAHRRARSRRGAGRQDCRPVRCTGRGLSIRELERIRDDNLIGILQALECTGESGWGAGELLRGARNAMRECSAGGDRPPTADSFDVSDSGTKN